MEGRGGAGSQGRFPEGASLSCGGASGRGAGVEGPTHRVHIGLREAGERGVRSSFLGAGVSADPLFFGLRKGKASEVPLRTKRKDRGRLLRRETRSGRLWPFDTTDLVEPVTT